MRFLTLVVVAWAGGRAWMVSGERIENPAAAARAPHVATHKQGASAVARLISWLPSLSPFRSNPHHLVIDLPVERGDARQSSASSPVTLRPVRLAAKKPELLMPEKPSPPARFDLDQAVRAASRWSGSAWVFVRDRGTGGSLATLGQLGGSQAGARLRWRLNAGDQIRSALYGRISTPLDDLSGAEAAFGAEWHPLPGQPFWVAAERRVALGKQGRDAWAACRRRYLESRPSRRNDPGWLCAGRRGRGEKPRPVRRRLPPPQPPDRRRAKPPRWCGRVGRRSARRRAARCWAPRAHSDQGRQAAVQHLRRLQSPRRGRCRAGVGRCCHNGKRFLSE